MGKGPKLLWLLPAGQEGHGVWVPMPTLRQGAVLEGDESLWNEKTACSGVVSVNQLVSLLHQHLESLFVFLEETNSAEKG